MSQISKSLPKQEILNELMKDKKVLVTFGTANARETFSRSMSVFVSRARQQFADLGIESDIGKLRQEFVNLEGSTVYSLRLSLVPVETFSVIILDDEESSGSSGSSGDTRE